MIQKPETDQTFRVNDNVSITCEATGSPSPVIYWATDLLNYVPHPQIGNVLRFEQIQFHDAGTYVCYAENLQLDGGIVQSVRVEKSVSIHVIAGELHAFHALKHFHNHTYGCTHRVSEADVVLAYP